jgi:hypothetical protein
VLTSPLLLFCQHRNAMRHPCLAIVPLLALVSCTAIKPLAISERTLVGTPHTFSHEDFDRVLHRFVDEQGRVDYTALKNDPRDLERYYLLLSTYSPDSHPVLFPIESSKLAYWLNAYNATVIKTVLAHYPISSVEDIKPPLPLLFLPSKSGFFLLQRVTFGGKTTNLYFLEHRVIRRRFADPRVHFALNCASRGCPRLPRQAFTAEHLDEQLDHAVRQFLAEERNFTINHQEKTVSLSSIFDWYENDFLSWYQNQFPGQKATLLNYVALYVSPEKAGELKWAASYDVRFIPYDWRLNDQNGRV